MENRRSSRTPLRQRVGLDSSRGGPVSAYARDLSLGGMFIETGALLLPENAYVNVSFNLRYDDNVDTFNLNAAVVRRGPGGLGLMFLQMEPDVIRTLSNALARYH